MKLTSFAIRLAVVTLLIAAASTAAASYDFIKVIEADAGFTEQIGYPSISKGQVAFQYSDGTTAGIYVGNGGPLTTIARSGDPGPNGPLLSFDYNPSVSDGTVAFFASWNGGAEYGIFTGNGGPLTNITQNGDFFNPIISHGVTAFHSFSNNGQGIFKADNGSLIPIIKSGDAAPVGSFDLFSGVSFEDGNAAVVGYYDDGAASGVFSGNGGTLTSIVKTGGPAPVGVFNIPTIPNETVFSSTAIDGDNVAFVGQFGRAAGEFSSGIFVSDGSSLTTIVKYGDPAPLGTFSHLSSFEPLGLHGDMVAFVGSYSLNPNTHGLFTGRGGRPTAVITSGDPLFGSTLAALHAIDLDEVGNIAFRYFLADGRYGLAMARPVPEPTALGLLAVGLAAIVGTLADDCFRLNRRKVSDR